jgi:hypothetical protein
MTIVPNDTTVTIDGVSFSDIDMSSIDPSIHAVQWYENHGDVEIKNATTGKMVANVTIDSISIFDNIINQFNKLKAEHDASIANGNTAELKYPKTEGA